MKIRTTVSIFFFTCLDLFIVPQLTESFWLMQMYLLQKWPSGKSLNMDLFASEFSTDRHQYVSKRSITYNTTLFIISNPLKYHFYSNYFEDKPPGSGRYFLQSVNYNIKIIYIWMKFRSAFILYWETSALVRVDQWEWDIINILSLEIA